MINRKKSIYLIEMIDVPVDEMGNGILDEIIYTPYYFCDSQNDAIIICDKLNNDIEKLAYHKVKDDEDLKYPVYQFSEIYKYELESTPK